MLLAQVPQAIKCQAVVRDSTGSIMENANITVRVSILDSAAGVLKIQGLSNVIAILVGSSVAVVLAIFGFLLMRNKEKTQ